MINTINIGEYVYDTLKQDEFISSRVTKIAPLVVSNDTKFPFIVYTRTSLYSVSSKDVDYVYEDEAVVEIKVETETYYEGVAIANRVRELLEVSYAEYKDLAINDTTLTMASEEFNNAFIQRMQFKLKINTL